VYGRLAAPPPVTADLMQRGGSKAWVTRMQTPAAVAGYEVGAEAEEHTARGWPRLATAGPNPLTGPQVWVGLRQHGVSTSAGFDWDYLHSLWPLMAAARSDWMATRPGLVAAYDRESWKRIGPPATLGDGFGDREAIKRHTCMFGAKFRLPADIRLGDLVDELQRVLDVSSAAAACGRTCRHQPGSADVAGRIAMGARASRLPGGLAGQPDRLCLR
jgi:hypothetical protein